VSWDSCRYRTREADDNRLLQSHTLVTCNWCTRTKHGKCGTGSDTSELYICNHIIISYIIFDYVLGVRGSIVVRALCYKPGSRGFQTRRCEIFQIT
jgi:hypothetical protein